jgi:shikimate kinase
VLEEFLEKERIVVSTGGGLGANPTAMEKMKSAGLVVWLDLDFDTFLQRCAHQEGRPLLKERVGLSKGFNGGEGKGL